MIPFHRKRLGLLGFILFSCLTNIGQERQSYEGPMQVGPYLGKAQYQYIISAQDTLFDGAFQVQRSSLEALLEKEDASFLFKGSFDKGAPTGSWGFQFGEFQTDSRSEVIDYEYRVLISGIQEEGTGTLTDGRPDGPWTYTVNQIKDSKIQNTLFASALTFATGIPQQNFRIENQEATLVGRFLRNGLAHDEWTSYTINALEDVESWFFEEGVLRRMVVVKDGKSQEVEVFTTASDEQKVIPLSNGYLEVVRTTLRANGTSLALQTGIPDLLAENESYYRKMDTVLLQLGPSNLRPNFMVKVPYFPMDTAQLAQVKTISADFLAAKAIGSALLKNSHLNIVKRSDNEALYNYNAVALIDERFLKPLEKFVSYAEQDILHYVDRSKFIETLWPNGKPSPELQIVADSSGTTRTFALADFKADDFEANDLTSIGRLSAYARRGLEQIKETLSDQLTNEERQQQLNGLEEDLIALNESLVRQIDSALTTLPKDYKVPIQEIKRLADASLSQYATMKNADEKLSYGTSLKTCLEQLTQLTQTLIALPQQKEEIEVLYQDSIWNPFMATVMDEEVKRRITAAYFNVLVPYFLSQVKTELTCDTVERLNNQIIHTNQRMLILREEDTRKLERKLRREKDAGAILELLHRQTTVKEK